MDYRWTINLIFARGNVWKRWVENLREISEKLKRLILRVYNRFVLTDEAEIKLSLYPPMYLCISQIHFH